MINLLRSISLQEHASSQSVKIRDNLFQQFKSTKSADDFMLYKQFRDRIVNKIREIKKSYYHHYFDEHKSNMKMLWNGIKSIITLKSGNVGSISYLKEEDCSKICDPVIIANKFNEYFTTVATIADKTHDTLCILEEISS